MKPRVDEEWWKDLFDEMYLLTDARSVCDEELTCREVDFLQETLCPDASDPILDLCGGQGRHSLEFSSRGYTDVTVLDYSQYLIDLGRRRADREGLDTTFIRGDARDTRLPPHSYRFIIVMASSFGYFADEAENKRIIAEAFRLLMPEGMLLLDMPDRSYVLKNFKAASRHRVDEDITVIRERELGEDIIYSREIVVSKKEGRLRDQRYLIRLYSLEKISEMMQSAGFSTVRCVRDFMSREEKGDYGTMTNRMVVIAQKEKR